MKILLSSKHRYPAGGRHGTGKSVNDRRTGGAAVVHDLLAKGLAELGHEVFYWLLGADEELPTGVTVVPAPCFEVDIVHHYNTQYPPPQEALGEFEARGLPFVATCHLSPEYMSAEQRSACRDGWIFVSRSLATSCGSSRYVVNGLDPADYGFRADKEDYLLAVVSDLGRATWKGLDTVLELVSEIGGEVLVAGSGDSAELIEATARRCAESGARFVGDVRGAEKAELFAGARAYLFPTQLDEACPLTVIEALMSGTPVICSDRGACPELVSPETGFLCRTREDFIRAIERVDEISPAACRHRALEHFHYHRMAAGYLRQYEALLSG